MFVHKINLYFFSKFVFWRAVECHGAAASSFDDVFAARPFRHELPMGVGGDRRCQLVAATHRVVLWRYDAEKRMLAAGQALLGVLQSVHCGQVHESPMIFGRALKVLLVELGQASQVQVVADIRDLHLSG